MQVTFIPPVFLLYPLISLWKLSLEYFSKYSALQTKQAFWPNGSGQPSASNLQEEVYVQIYAQLMKLCWLTPEWHCSCSAGNGSLSCTFHGASLFSELRSGSHQKEKCVFPAQRLTGGILLLLKVSFLWLMKLFRCSFYFKQYLRMWHHNSLSCILARRSR